MDSINLTPYFDESNFIDSIYQFYEGFQTFKMLSYVVIKDNKIKVRTYLQNLYELSPKDLIKDAVIRSTSDGYDFVGPLSYKYDLNFWYSRIKLISPNVDYELDENNRLQIF